MLSFDIETTGLNMALDRITCICACDPTLGFKLTIFPDLGDDAEPFLEALDAADVICAFNGARFDLPFVCKEFRVSLRRAGKWRLKLMDLCEFCGLTLGTRVPMNSFLEDNGIPCKTGDGLHAIELANASRVSELAAYCMDDAVKTWQLHSLPVVRVRPRNWREMAICIQEGRGMRWICAD